MSDCNGWRNRETYNVALWIIDIEDKSNHWGEATRTMKKSAWVAMIQGEYPLTGDGYALTDPSVNWDEIYNHIKGAWAKCNGWRNRETYNVALWLGNIEGKTNRWGESTRAMNKSAWVAMIQGEYPVTGDGYSLADPSVNWDEIFNHMKGAWAE